MGVAGRAELGALLPTVAWGPSGVGGGWGRPTHATRWERPQRVVLGGAPRPAPGHGCAGGVGGRAKGLARTAAIGTRGVGIGRGLWATGGPPRSVACRAAC